MAALEWQRTQAARPIVRSIQTHNPAAASVSDNASNRGMC